MARRSSDSKARLLEKNARKNMRAAMNKALSTLRGKDSEEVVKAAFVAEGFTVAPDEDSLIWVDNNGVSLRLKSPGAPAELLLPASLKDEA